MRKNIFLLIILGVVVVIMSMMSKEFLRFSTLLESLRYAVEMGIMAVPMTMVIITAGIDLSVASTLALSGILMGIIWKYLNLNIWLAGLFAILVGSGCGLLNAYMITGLSIPPIVVTLATMAAYRGIATGLSKGRGITGFPESFQNFGQGSFMNFIPYSVFIWMIVALVGYVVLEKSKFGRYIYSIGHNETGAMFSAVPVVRVKNLLYLFSGMMAGLSGMIYSARIGAAKSNAFMGGELEVITAVVLGGTSITGGEGSILGSTLGVLIITFLKTGLNLARVPHSVQSIIVGIVLVASIITYTRFGVGFFKKIKKGGV